MSDIEEWVTNDARPQRHGWATGFYTARCGTCGKRFMGDKRAVTCAPCAYAEPDTPPKGISDLEKLVAQALQKCGFKADERDAADIIAALRDQPADVIEAGAKALFMHGGEADYTKIDWQEMDQTGRDWWLSAWLASWRAALDVRERT